ncbi:MAG TPA: isoprenylcysteine carboxylmethyltransferase family protein [Planctomycetota bacterium]|nr:isoprenylcysteine carboxylmethyltransferase family protein [Planctomycetota bacterium]
MNEFIRKFVRKYGQLVVNWVVFLGIGRWIAVKAWEWHKAGELFNFVEFTFLLHIVVLLVLVVIRTRHLDIDRNIFHQLVALAAFFSALGFVGQKTTSEALIWSARTVTFIALVLGILTQLNLGRSFGILIARRKIKTDWLYGVIRHPMYVTDILFKVGMILKMPSWPNAAVLAFGVGCYVYRALLEEKFLSQNEEYREYMKRVRYRFLPWIF